jgi:hypothetical protein
VLYVALIAAVVLRFHQEVARIGSLHVSAAAGLGRELFHAFLPIQMGFVALAAMAAASDAVAREARAGTLGLLLLTPLPLRRIAAGKWQAAMAQSASLVLCGLPVLGICFYLGGVGPWELLWSSATTLALSALAAAYTLRFSARHDSGLLAFFAAAWRLAVLSLLPALFAVSGVPAFRFLAGVVHPAFAAAAATAGPVEGLPYAWIPGLIPAALLTLRWLRLAGEGIERRAQESARPALAAPRDFDTNRSYYGRERKGRKRLVVEAGVWEKHPLLWKELATRAAARWSTDLRVSVVALFFFLLLVAGFLVQDPGALLLPVGTAAGLLALAQGASLFIQEREGRKVDVLLSTPAGIGPILGSKLLSGVLSPESLGVLGLGALLFLPFGVRLRAGGAAAAVSALLGLAFPLVLAGTASLYAKSLRNAFLAGLVGVTLIYAVTPWMLSNLDLGAAGRRAAWAASPVAFLFAMDDGWTRGGQVHLLRAFLAQALGYSAVIALLILLMARRLRSLGERP